MKSALPSLRLILVAIACGLPVAPFAHSQPLSPTSMVVAPDLKRLYVACDTANQVLVVDVSNGETTKTVRVPGPPSGLVLSSDGKRLLATIAAAGGRLAVIDVAKGEVEALIRVGHTPMSPVIHPEGELAYVCNRFDGSISEVDLATAKELRRLKLAREPISAAITVDGGTLLVAHHLPDGSASEDIVAGTVSVVDLDAWCLKKTLRLPNGSTTLREIRVSPDGRYAAVTHVLARFQLPTTQLDRGWMNTNGLTLIDLRTMEIINTVLLDEIDYGAANPWALAWTGDMRWLCVTHAGTRELSVLDFPQVIEKLAGLPEQRPVGRDSYYSSNSLSRSDVPNDLAFLVDLRERYRLKGIGPRAVAIAGSTVYVGNYFTDSIDHLDLASDRPRAEVIELGGEAEMAEVRWGELLFNDATICFQQWQSCASCHSEDARIDGLNWDLLNDGLGNPKNTKTLLLSHATPPSMSLGVRSTGEAAVRAGIRHILFAVRPEPEAEAMDAYLKSLQPVPSPHLVDGALSASALRGEQVFMSAEVGCAFCHPPGKFTDQKTHQVGTAGQFDREQKAFDTPSLVELWRTAPYLHDGSAATVRELLTVRNPADQHGGTSHLTPRQIEDLTEYLLSL